MKLIDDYKFKDELTYSLIWLLGVSCYHEMCYVEEQVLFEHNSKSKLFEQTKDKKFKKKKS